MSDNKDIPVYFPLTEQREILFRSDVVARYSVGKNPTLVLETKSGMAYVEAGETAWRLSFAKHVCITPNDSKDRVMVEASWYTAQQAQQAGIKVVAGSNANVFAGLGVLLVPDGFRIPAVVATPENVKFYGLQLLAKGEAFTLTSTEYDMALIEYDYKKNYRDDFLTQTEGGGGFFVERHNFPHLHIPLDNNCGGYIVIGKQMTQTMFAFTAFNIPHNHALYTPANTIHGDGTLIGNHGITVAKSSAKADTVLFYNKRTISKADDIVPVWKG